tara:strand:- start:600 stop:1592 length:993 start_codon:yes stop_codon:yes gene_type:complete
MSTIRARTRNLLVPKYCTEQSNPKNNKNHLNNENRFKLLIKQLDNEIKKEGVNLLCFQEVSYKWGDRLKLYFQKNNFSTFDAHYGYWGNDYMGIMIAWDHNLFNATNFHRDVVADSIYTKLPENKSKKIYYYYKMMEYIKYFGINSSNFINNYIYKHEDNIFKNIETMSCEKLAKLRKNVLLSIVLKDKNNNKKFLVSNYHMPCLFNYPSVMMKHTETCLKLIKLYSEYEGAIPYLWGGDFNSTPNKDVYKRINESMTSLNKDGMDNEPDTIYCYTKRLGEFKGAIDYIFLSDGFKNIIPKKTEKLKKYLPNEDYPSDHISLGGSIELDV